MSFSANDPSCLGKALKFLGENDPAWLRPQMVSRLMKLQTHRPSRVLSRSLHATCEWHLELRIWRNVAASVFAVFIVEGIADFINNLIERTQPECD